MHDKFLDVGQFVASPRHAHYFVENSTVQAKIRQRYEILVATGRLDEKTPIVNIQAKPAIVEVHDGNATLVAWLLYMREQPYTPSLGLLIEHMPTTLVLHNRVHDSGAIWHPFVPREVASAERLEQLIDPEQNRATCKALDRSGMPIYFNDSEFFSGVDASMMLRDILPLLPF